MNNTMITSSAQLPDDSHVEELDLLILGGGTGSTVATWTFVGDGKRVAAIDRKYIGGSCPKIVCLPSKNIIHSAKVASYFRHSQEFGITHSGAFGGWISRDGRERRLSDERRGSACRVDLSA